MKKILSFLKKKYKKIQRFKYFFDIHAKAIGNTEGNPTSSALHWIWFSIDLTVFKGFI